MRKQKRTQDDVNWEELIHTMISILGIERFCDVVDYVVERMDAEELRLRNFALETQRAQH